MRPPTDAGLCALALLVLAACGGSGESDRRDPALAGQAPPPASEETTGGGDTGSAEASTDAPAAANDDEVVARVLEGRASYYSDSLAGNRTANGDVYDPGQLTAASRDLPFGTRVRVVRVETGQSVVVRVNDRGPFRDHSRILDLSRAAAEALGMIDAGVVEIRAEVLE